MTRARGSFRPAIYAASYEDNPVRHRGRCTCSRKTDHIPLCQIATAQLPGKPEGERSSAFSYVLMFCAERIPHYALDCRRVNIIPCALRFVRARRLNAFSRRRAFIFRWTAEPKRLRHRTANLACIEYQQTLSLPDSNSALTPPE